MVWFSNASPISTCSWNRIASAWMKLAGWITWWPRLKKKTRNPFSRLLFLHFHAHIGLIRRDAVPSPIFMPWLPCTYTPKKFDEKQKKSGPCRTKLVFWNLQAGKRHSTNPKIKNWSNKKNQRIIGSKAAQATQSLASWQTTASLCTSHLGKAMRMKTIENFAALWDPSGTADWEAATFAAIDGQQLWVSENWHKVNFGFKSIHYKFGINFALSLVLNLCFSSLCNLEDF